MNNSQLLAAARPDPVVLDPTWEAATLRRILDSAVSQTPTRQRRRYSSAPRRTIALGAAAALVVVGVAGSSLIHPENASASDLMALSTSAASYHGPVLEQGTWLHEQTTSLQHNSGGRSDGTVWDTNRESWTSWDGRSYIIEQRPSTGRTEYEITNDRFPPSVADPTPQFAASLPKTSAALLAYLDPRVSGSSSHDEALFEALSRLATSHTLPPQTLAATFEAFTTIDNVQTNDVTVQGQPAIVITYAEELTHSSQQLTVDRASGQVLATHNASRQSDFVSTTHLSEVVNDIPQSVQDAFQESAKGGVPTP